MAEQEKSPLIVTCGDGIPLADQKAAIAEFKAQCLRQSEPMFDIAGISNDSDEWYTPSWMFRALGVYFDLDPCSPGVPPSTCPAKRHLTKADNGLTAPWDGTVWLNPPFSSKRQWYERLLQHGDGIALMPARTDTHDLQTYMQAAQALLFVRGRVNFERGHRPGGNRVGGKTTAPPFGIVLCAYGEEMAEALLCSDVLGVRARVYCPVNQEGPQK